MKIYLAGGMTIMNVQNREIDIWNKRKISVYRRLYSFYFEHNNLLEKSGMLKLIENENILCSRSTG